MKSGHRVGIVCTSSSVLLFYVNRHLKRKLLKDKVPKLRHALVDLYGCCDQVKLLPLEKAPSEQELLKSVCIIYIVHMCMCIVVFLIVNQCGQILKITIVISCCVIVKQKLNSGINIIL